MYFEVAVGTGQFFKSRLANTETYYLVVSALKPKLIKKRLHFHRRYVSQILASNIGLQGNTYTHTRVKQFEP